MKVKVKEWHAIAHWKWDTYSNAEDEAANDGDGEEDLCGICRVSFEGCCPACKLPGEDCPLIWGQCTHVFHLHCLDKWLSTPASKQQCPLDRRVWVMAKRTVSS